MAIEPTRGEVFNRDAWTAWRLVALGGGVSGILSLPPLTLAIFPIAGPYGLGIGAVVGLPVALCLAGALQAAPPHRCNLTELKAQLGVVGAVLAVIPAVILQSSLGTGIEVNLAGLVAGDALTAGVGAWCGVRLARSHVRAWGGAA